MVLTGEVVLPSCLKKLQPWTVDLPQRRYTWFSNEEIASILINFKKHSEWMTPTRVHRPENGKLLMFNRKKVKYRQDTYIWKTKRKSKWPREDHVKLKVHSIPCISAVYVHSDVLPSFHRRCYWFIQNPDVVLVHYLNFPYMDDDIHITKDFSLNPQCQQWQDLTKQDILEQIQPMFSNMPWPRISDPFLSDEYVKKLTNNLVDQHFEQLRCRIYKKLNDRCIGQLRAIQPKSDAITELGNTSSVSLTSCRGSNSNSLTSIGTGQQTVSNCSRNNSNVELHNASKINTASTIPTNVLSNGSTVIILSQPSIADRNIAPTNNAIYASCDIATSTTQIDMDNSITISFETPASAVPFSNLSNDQQMVCQTITPLLPHTGTSNPLVQDCHNIEGSTTLMTNCRDDAKEKSVKAKEIISCSSQVHSVFDQVQSNFEDMATLPREEAKQSVNCIDHTLVKSKSCNELLMLSKSPSDKLTDPLSSTATPLHSSNFNNEMSLSLPVRTNGDALGLSASWNHDDLLYENNAHKSDYGAKDVMVPNCRSSKGQSDLSPFAGHQIQSSSELLDVFDVDSLFNTNTSEESISPLQRLTNPSTEYTVGDLFPQHLWDPVLREADGHLGISSSNPNEQSECALSNLAEIQSFTQAMPPDEMSRLETITDYSPDWSYTEGGIKVLLTGTWSAPGNYNCSFNEVCVPATILQPGVLRCYCPAHNVGHVNLLIKRDGLVVSYAVKFEYKLIPSPYRDVSRYWLQLNENEFKMSILERLERMEKRLNSMGYSNNICNTGDQNMPGGGLHYRIRGLSSEEPESTTKSELDFEQRLILLCCQISQASSEQRSALCEAENSSGDGLTLLHYTTALGYVRLLKSLRLMRQESDNEFLRYECDPRSRDRLDCTPLMWACAAGHLGCIDVLLEWNASCLHIVDVLGRSPASLAQQYGHMTIFNRLECMIDEANRNNSVLQDENEDTADTSSIGDTTASSVLDTADSGEDSMETDDNLSIEPDSIQAEVTQCDDCNFSFEWQGFENDLNTSQEVGSQSTSNTPSQTSTGLGIENSLPRMPLNDTTFEGQSDCLTVLAEQIVEAAPDYLKYEGDGGQEYSDNDLTLRSLPFYVNSRCGAGVYPTFTTNQNYNIFRRDAPIVNRMNWSEFLQLPPRPVLPEARYQSNNDLELDSFRLTENEQRQLYLAATTVLKAYHCEGLPLQTEVLRASLLIQGCYRKYKKFAVNKKMNEAAVLIQSKFRSYQEQKRFQKSRHAAILIQSFYRSYKYTRAGERSTKRTVRLIEDALRGHMTKKKQHQAARKIQRFLRQCRYRLRQQELSAESKSKSPRMAGYYTC